jgi:hypothetical protein
MKEHSITNKFIKDKMEYTKKLAAIKLPNSDNENVKDGLNCEADTFLGSCKLSFKKNIKNGSPEG